MGRANLSTAEYIPLRNRIREAGKPVKLGHETTAALDGERIIIRHYGSTIAIVEPWEVFVTNAGYDTVTTAHRIAHVLRSNHIPATVRVHNYEHCLEMGDEHRSFTAETFEMVAGTWQRVA